MNTFNNLRGSPTLNVELIFNDFLKFSREMYKETKILKQKLVEIEIIDLRDSKVFSFFNEINKFMNFPTLSFEPRSTAKILIKMKENSGIFDPQKLINNLYLNSEIRRKFSDLLLNAEPFQFFVISSNKERKLFEILRFCREKWKLQEIYSLNENLKKTERLFVIFGEVHADFEFKKTIDFFKIFSIFNGDINIICKFFSKKALKGLLGLEFPLLSREVVKIFEAQTIFSLFSDCDCFLMNTLENAGFDFDSSVFVNSTQFFNPLNLAESLYLFGRLFPLDSPGVQLPRSIFSENGDEISLDIIMGVSSKIPDSMFVFYFLNKTVVFESGNEANRVMNKALSTLDMRPYGFVSFLYQTDISDPQGNFLKRMFLKRNSSHSNKKLKNYSVFLAINLEISESGILNAPFLAEFIKSQIYSIFESYRQETDYRVLNSAHERKLLETFNNDIPRISESLENLSRSLQRMSPSIRDGLNKLPSKTEINKKLWAKLLFD